MPTKSFAYTYIYTYTHMYVCMAKVNGSACIDYHYRKRINRCREGRWHANTGECTDNRTKTIFYGEEMRMSAYTYT